MHRRNLLHLLPLLLLVMDNVSARVDYFALLEDIDIAHRLKLLEPETVLRNYDIDRRQDGRSSRSACERDVALYERAIGKRESWALKMLDSSSRVPIGLLRGHVIELGMFNECMEVKATTVGNEIRGRHCMYEIRPDHGNDTFPINPMLSICLPSSCNDRDVVGLFNGVINRSDELRELGLAITGATCTSSQDKQLNIWTIIFLLVNCIYICFLLACTWLDMYERRHDRRAQILNKKCRLMTRFSMLKSTETILSTESREGDLAFLHGIRVVSCCWIVLFHQYFMRLFGSINDLVNLTEWFTSRKSLIILMGPQSVDTFLAVSGFMVAYTAFKKIQKTKKFINVPLYYVHRYVRLTLPVAAIVFGSMALGPLFGSGPQFERLMNMFVMDCSSKWWSTLLYIQNFIDVNNDCLIHLWSLSVDMQLYWISPLILYPLYKKPKIGLIIVSLLLLASTLTMSVIMAINKYSGIFFTLDFSKSHPINTFRNVYIQTYTRAMPWLIGIYFGYKVTHEKRKPSKKVVCTGWFLAALAFTFCFCGTRSFTLEGYEYSAVWEMLFPPLSKIFWAFGVCWIIYACVNDVAGSISTSLSWKYFRPLSKLSYSIYLTHIVFPAAQILLSRIPIQWSDFIILQSYLSNMLLSVVLAFVYCVIYEMPMLVVDSLLFKETPEPQWEGRIEEKSNSTSEILKTK